LCDGVWKKTTDASADTGRKKRASSTASRVTARR
jgi:hypothetical protein